MSETLNLADIVAEWAVTQPSVKAVILIGSRVRPASDSVWAADAQSDWDFQIISSRPKMFLDGGWTKDLAGTQLITYVARTARIGGVPKINVVFHHAEADFVVLPAGIFSLFRFLAGLGLHRKVNLVRRRLQELALVIRPGWRFLKGADAWESFYLRAIAELPDPRLSDDDVRHLADGFVCDYVSIVRKINRGEFIAAQRLVHRDLAETNFRLLHEIRLRQGKRSFPEARRIERLMDLGDLQNVAIEAHLDAKTLHAAAEKSASSLQVLMRGLVGESWHWPKL